MRMIMNGGSIPDVPLGRMEGDEIRAESARKIFAKGRSVVLGIPGAFTPICTNQHLPDFVNNAARIRASGIDHLYCIAPNDPFVLAAWAWQVDPDKTIEFLSDGNLEFASALNLTAKHQELFLGLRSERYLLMINHGTIVSLRVEPNILTYSCTRASDAVDGTLV